MDPSHFSDRVLTALQFEDGPEDPFSALRLAVIQAAHLLPAWHVR